MGVSLKRAASQLLKWNIEGQKYARALRGDWVERNEDTGKCTACKIGMVMIGRYGLKKALDYYQKDRLTDTLAYGPLVYCPIRGCKSYSHDFRDMMLGPGRKHPLGAVIEHLFEKHKRSVMWIDKWLAKFSETTGGK